MLVAERRQNGLGEIFLAAVLISGDKTGTKKLSVAGRGWGTTFCDEQPVDKIEYSRMKIGSGSCIPMQKERNNTRNGQTCFNLFIFIIFILTLLLLHLPIAGLA